MSLEAEKYILSDLARLASTEKAQPGNVNLEQTLLAFTGQLSGYEQALFDPDLQLALNEKNVKPNMGDPNLEEEKKEEEKQAAEEEKKETDDTKEAKDAQEVKDTQEESQENAQEKKLEENQALDKPVEENVNIDDVSVVSLLSPSFGFVFFFDEHLSEAFRMSYGMPILEQSVPRNLGIQNDFLGVIYHTFPVFPIEVPAAVSGPCCVNPIDIAVDQTLSSSSSYFTSDELTQISNILNNAFKFTFEYFCDKNEGVIVASQVAGGVEAYTGIPDSYSAKISTYENFTPETFIIRIPSGDESFCAPINCDNPIVSIHVNITNNEYFNLPRIDLFSNSYQENATIYFIDSNGSQWELVNNKKEFELQCAESECEYEYEQSTAPLVFDLDNNGYDISSVKDSSVVLNIDGVDKKVGWVGPNDGLLTYNYGGEGAIENKHFILTDNVQGAKTDLQALQMLADQKSGLLDMSNAIWDKLGMWQDGNQDGKMDNGEYHTLSDLKIASINLTGDGDIHKVNGNLIVNNVTFNYQDGSVGKAADAILKTEDVVQADQNIPGIGNASSAPAVAANDAVAAPVAPLQVDMAVQSAIEVQQPVAAVG